MKFVQILLVHRDGRIRALRIPCSPHAPEEAVLDEFDPSDLTGDYQAVFADAIDTGFRLAGFGSSIVETAPGPAPEAEILEL